MIHPSRFVPSSKVSLYFLSKPRLHIKALPDNINFFQRLTIKKVN